MRAGMTPAGPKRYRFRGYAAMLRQEGKSWGPRSGLRLEPAVKTFMTGTTDSTLIAGGRFS